MQYSVVSYKKVLSHKELRLEAEYYRPIFLNLEQKLNDLGAENFGDYVDAIKCGPFGSTILCDTYHKGGVIVARPFNIKEYNLENENLAYISKQDCIDKGLDFYKSGDIIFSRVGDMRCGIIPYMDNELTISPNIIAVKTNKKKLNPYYAVTFFNTKYGLTQLIRNMKVVAQPTISTDIIGRLKICIFTNKIQEMIERLFQKYFICKKYSMEQIVYAEEILLKSLNRLDCITNSKKNYIKNFSDTQNANRIDAEYFQPKYDEIIDKIKSYSNGRDILDDIVLIKKGIEIGTDAYTEEGIPFIRVSNLNKFGITENSQQYLSEKLYEDLKSKYQPKKDDILLSKDGTPGIAYFLSENPQKMIISGGILRLVIKNKEYLPEYVTLVLNSIFVQEQIEQRSSGALIKHWLIDEIKNTVIPKLEIEKQQKIVDKIKDATLAQKQSKQLLEIAKKGVEKAIEKNEDIAMQWISEQLEIIGVSL